MGMTIIRTLFITAALLAGAALFPAQPVFAGSCCGGSAAVALILPKFGQSMIDTSLDMEKYNGFWKKDGTYQRDQPGTDLRQYRLNLGYALRLAKRWQASAAVPYVWNANTYSGISSHTDALGDTVLSLWYEAFDTTVCRLGWGDIGLSDLVPAATFGLSLTIPTGVSPYDDVKSSFDITGRGFYRLDANVLLDKTIYPWSASVFMSYGKHIERPVNREFGEYREPYRRNLGDRATGTLAISYETFIDSSDSRNRLTYTGAFSEVWEDEGTINGDRDNTSGLQKSSVAGTVAWSTLNRSWTVKLTWNHSINKSGWGSNTVASDIYSLGVTHVYE
jgi:hypothetical protein